MAAGQRKKKEKKPKKTPDTAMQWEWQTRTHSDIVDFGKGVLELRMEKRKKERN